MRKSWIEIWAPDFGLLQAWKIPISNLFLFFSLSLITCAYFCLSDKVKISKNIISRKSSQQTQCSFPGPEFYSTHPCVTGQPSNLLSSLVTETGKYESSSLLFDCFDYSEFQAGGQFCHFALTWLLRAWAIFPASLGIQYIFLSLKVFRRHGKTFALKKWCPSDIFCVTQFCAGNSRKGDRATGSLPILVSSEAAGCCLLLTHRSATDVEEAGTALERGLLPQLRPPLPWGNASPVSYVSTEVSQQLCGLSILPATLFSHIFIL